MSRQVDLVIYKGGNKFVIGRAAVEKTGAIEAQVAKDAWSTILEIFGERDFELAICPKE